MEETEKNNLLKNNQSKIIVAVVAVFVLIAGYFWYDNSQTKEYIQSIQYDVQSISQSRTTLEGYEKGGLAFGSFFENTYKINKDLEKSKENLNRSMPKNTASHAIKKAALDYTDAITKLCSSANDWRKYEMMNKYNKQGIEKVQKNYFEVKQDIQPKYDLYNNLVK